MMNFNETVRVLTTFYMDCAKYHAKETGDNEKAAKLALKDVESISYNPFSPNGELLNREAKKLFIETMQDGQ